MKTEAVAYLRVSSQGQQQGSGLDRQEKEIRAFVRRSEYKLIQVYSEAFTGTETDRPVFETMLADLLTNGCRVIIVECLDRLARDLGIQIQILTLLVGKGIKLINAMTGEEATSPSNPMIKAMVQMQGVFAELDKNMLVAKLKKSRDAKKAATGKCEGKKPFGYYPGEQKTLDRIKQLYRKGHKEDRRTCGEIGRILTREGYKTRGGGKWFESTVRQILRRLNLLK